MLIINKILVALTLLSHITLFVALVIVLGGRGEKLKIYLHEHALKLALLIAVVATSGSLFYSDVMGFDPCKLCWYQRIFMYPQVFLLGLAVYRKEKRIIDYSLLILIVGWFISVYHNIIYYRAISTSFCSSAEMAACNVRYIYELGYISIPLMALSAFTLMIIVLYYAKK